MGCLVLTLLLIQKWSRLAAQTAWFVCSTSYETTNLVIVGPSCTLNMNRHLFAPPERQSFTKRIKGNKHLGQLLQRYQLVRQELNRWADQCRANGHAITQHIGAMV